MKTRDDIDDKHIELPAYALNLRRLFAAAGVSQAEIARRAGMNRDALNRYTHGRSRPPARRVLAIAKALGCRPSEIDRNMFRLDLEAENFYIGSTYHMSPAKSGREGFVGFSLSGEIEKELALKLINLLEEAKKNK